MKTIGLCSPRCEEAIDAVVYDIPQLGRLRLVEEVDAMAVKGTRSIDDDTLLYLTYYTLEEEDRLYE